MFGAAQRLWHAFAPKKRRKGGDQRTDPKEGGEQRAGEVCEGATGRTPREERIR
jgi:hypothetical protein